MSFIVTQGFSLGPLYVHWYGITMAIAIVAAYVVALWQFRKSDLASQLTREQFDDAVFWVVVWGIIGARLYHVFSSGSYYLLRPIEIFEIWQGGLGIYGAVALGAVSLWWFCRKRSVSFGKFADVVAVGLPLGQAIGRLGNYFNYEAFGYPTTLAWKMFVPLQFRPERYARFAYFTPTFAYEMVLDLVVFVAMLWLARQRTSPASKFSRTLTEQPGNLVLIYAILYSVARFFVEYQRIDSTFISFGTGVFRLNQVAALLIILVASGILVARLVRRCNTTYEPQAS